MIAIVGLSPDGARRTFGQGRNQMEAEEQVQQATFAYLRGRPDCGPMDKWTFRPATEADLAAVTFSRDC